MLLHRCRRSERDPWECSRSFVVSDAPVPVPALKGFLSQKLEAYKLPAMILQIEKIPKNYMGKTDRNALKGIYAELGE